MLLPQFLSPELAPSCRLTPSVFTHTPVRTFDDNAARGCLFATPPFLVLVLVLVLVLWVYLIILPRTLLLGQPATYWGGPDHYS